MPALAARGGNKDDPYNGVNPCQSVANTCGVSGFKGKDIWKKCVEPLKLGKKVVTADGTVVAPDMPAACKNPSRAPAAGSTEITPREGGAEDSASTEQAANADAAGAAKPSTSN